jgi:acyl-CoA synthetase (AMP-forming)/AMP-acid ligase II
MPPAANRDVAVLALPSLTALLQYRAAAQPDDRAYVALSERGQPDAAITFAGLHCRAAALAAKLSKRAEPGARALLLFPMGIDCLVALFACLYAGIIAVPMMVPRRQGSRDSSASILADCEPRLALTRAELLSGARGDLVGRFQYPGLEWLAVDTAEARAEARAEADHVPHETQRGDIAVLQYTSGSTSAPKGVMVSHGNLLANLEMIRVACGNTRASTYVSWVPLYHDMGLVLNALQALYVGALCVLIPPIAFLQRPYLWLRAISDYRAEVAVSPNFGFDLCVDRYRPEQMAGIDLSCWKLALNGAEPVRADTIRRFAETFGPHGFAANAIYPAYGMAEATLLISGGRRGEGPIFRPISRAGLLRHKASEAAENVDSQTLVGCGRGLIGEEIAIVDPETGVRLGPDHIGEIWVSGPNVAQGYWRNPEATEATFRSHITGEAARPWLRTGDLGFLDGAGQLFITGRIKDVIIIRGANHYPQDIEATVQESHPALRRHGGAAFAIADDEHREQLLVVQEVERTARNRIVPSQLIGQIREAIVNEHDIVPREIALLRPGALPKTTSGKIQRALARKLWQEGRLEKISAEAAQRSGGTSN